MAQTENPDRETLLEALFDILEMTKPGSLYMNGTHGFASAGPEKVARIHNRARAAFGDQPLRPATTPARPR